MSGRARLVAMATLASTVAFGRAPADAGIINSFTPASSGSLSFTVANVSYPALPASQT